MVLKIREWQEELEKQKYVNILSTMRNIESQINYLEERLNIIKDAKREVFTSDELCSLYNEIQYLIKEIEEAKEFLSKLEVELEKEREIYEESIKERKKIEKIMERLDLNLKREREKTEKKIISDIFSVRHRSM